MAIFQPGRRVTVQEPVASGAYIGELKGHVGFKDDYIPEIHRIAGRCCVIPEPFVFFHPKVPIYVDARNEGTEFRYIRRSCMPNAQMKILVTDSTDYHFCFMATHADRSWHGDCGSPGIRRMAYRSL